jgi:hypothetical protein
VRLDAKQTWQQRRGDAGAGHESRTTPQNERLPSLTSAGREDEGSEHE